MKKHHKTNRERTLKGFRIFLWVQSLHFAFIKLINNFYKQVIKEYIVFPFANLTKGDSFQS